MLPRLVTVSSALLIELISEMSPLLVAAVVLMSLSVDVLLLVFGVLVGVGLAKRDDGAVKREDGAVKRDDGAVKREAGGTILRLLVFDILEREKIIKSILIKQNYL